MTQKMSDILSQRSVQPGTKNTGAKSEYEFAEVVERWLQSKKDFNLKYIKQPRGLRKLFGEYGIQPEGMLVLDNKYVWFFEVKYQKDGGNAQERVYRLFTSPFQNTLSSFIQEKCGYKPMRHPYSAIFTGSLAAREKYLSEFKCCLEEDSYFCWKDKTEYDWLAAYLDYVLSCLLKDKYRYEEQ